MIKALRMEVIKMFYDKSELSYDYRHSKNKNNQIKILAECNATSVYEICKCLDECGLLEKGYYADNYYILKGIHNNEGTEYFNQFPPAQIKRVRKIYEKEKWIWDKMSVRIKETSIMYTVEEFEKIQKELEDAKEIINVLTNKKIFRKSVRNL